jgi:hypothetical protein
VRDYLNIISWTNHYHRPIKSNHFFLALLQKKIILCVVVSSKSNSMLGAYHKWGNDQLGFKPILARSQGFMGVLQRGIAIGDTHLHIYPVDSLMSEN